MTNQNESLIKQFSNVPNPSSELKAWTQAAEPQRELEEAVLVKMAPSFFFRDFVSEYLKTVDKFFIGPFKDSKPQLDASALRYETEGVEFSTKKLIELIQAGHSEDEIFEMQSRGKKTVTMTEEEILCRYFETEFWAIVAYFKREFCREPHLKELLNFIGKNSIYTPILVVNALNCIGPVQVVDKAIRLEPTFVDGYDYKKRVLTKAQMIAVSDWFAQLEKHGFKCVEYLKLGADGNRDFMMMTLEHSETPSKEELNGQSQSKTKFVVRSTKLSGHMIALYKYFFWTDDVDYLSSDRRIFKYGDSDHYNFNMRDIVRTMLNITEGELFTASKTTSSSAKADLLNPNKDPNYQAEQSRDDKAQHEVK